MASIVSGRKAVTTGGTAERLSTVSVAINSIRIMAATANTNPVVIGGSDVVAALGTRKGIALRATDPPVTFDAQVDGVDELSDIWVDAVTSGEAVTYLYTTAS